MGSVDEWGVKCPKCNSPFWDGTSRCVCGHDPAVNAGPPSMSVHEPCEPVVSDDTGGGGGRQMLIGLVICALGIVLTVLSHNSAKPGGHYTVFYGAIVCGAINFVRGMCR